MFLEPHFVEPYEPNFNYLSYSPCIDAGDPELPLDPDATRADIGAIPYFQSQGPAMNLSATTISYPQTEIGEIAEQDITISNNGGADLVIDSITAVTYPGVFYTNWTPAQSIIIPGASITVTVSFSPVAVTAYSDFLFIYNNDELGIVSLSGEGTPVNGIKDDDSQYPSRFCLKSVFPNPCNSSANIEFSLEKSAFTKLAVYDITGKAISVISQGWMEAGHYSLSFNGAGLPSGVYFIKLDSLGKTDLNKITLLK